MPSGTDDEGEYQYPYPRPPLSSTSNHQHHVFFPNLSGISVSSPLLNSVFSYTFFFSLKNV